MEIGFIFAWIMMAFIVWKKTAAMSQSLQAEVYGI